MRNKSSGIKAKYTKKRKEAAKKAASKVKNKQWEPEKIKFLLGLKNNSDQSTCIVCGDSRPIVLQAHHVDPKREDVVKLCANCHDVVRRGTLEDLKKAHMPKK